MIVCLGWGSLVWDSRNLKLDSDWFPDGPSVPVEFARQSQDGRLTLVMSHEFQKLPSHWASMAYSKLDDSVECLRVREGTSRSRIGIWESGTPVPQLIPTLAKWAKTKGVKSVIWTALPPKFKGEDHRSPTLAEAIQYLTNLESSQKAKAKEYVQRAPTQVMTPYRIEIERCLGWQLG